MYSLTDPDRRMRSSVHARDSCGCGPCRPRCLHPLARPSVFSALMAVILIIELAAISGYIGAITSTLEKEFLLSSSEVGAISIINDVVSLLVVGIFTYFGHSAHRPRLIGSGAVLVGVGTALCAAPHFVTDRFSSSAQLNGSAHQLCGEPGNGTRTDANVDSQSKLSSLYLFIIGQVLVGLGNAPIIPLAMTYVDDAVEKYKTTAHVAVIYIGTSVGPIVGFLVSSQTLLMYVNADITPSEGWPAVLRNDPRWIGAWWLGLLIFGAAMVLFALPLFLFPRRLRAPEESKKGDGKSLDVPGLRCNGVELRSVRDGVPKFVDRMDSHLPMTEADELEHACSNEDEKTDKLESKAKTHIIIDEVKDFMLALLRLGRNLTLVALALGMASELAIVSGITTFGAKYTETQFGISAGRAAFINGIAILPASCAGHLLAGAILRRFRLSALQCSVFLCVTVFITLCIYPVLIFLGCDTPVVVSSKPPSCDTRCMCDATVIDPVCGVDNVTYLSPCVAGCASSDVGNKTFSSCSCIQHDNLEIGSETNSSGGYEAGSWDATESACPVTCTMMIAYIVMSSMSLFFMFMGQNPTMIINLRCVEEKDRSFAIGMVTCLVKVIGFFPAPVYFGEVIKSTCLLYSSSGGTVAYEDTGSAVCWHYNLPVFRRRFFGLLIGLKSCTLIFFVIVMISLWRKGKGQEQASTSSESSSF